MPLESGSKKAVFAALLGNLAIAVFKLFAALISRSSSMLAESYHSFSDTMNQVLLLYGLKRSRRKPDDYHPFGYGKEQFFWSFVVAILLFGIAGTLSVREGLHKFSHSETIQNIWLTYLAIAVGVFFESIAFRMAVKSLKKEKKTEGYKNLLTAVRNSKDPTMMTVFIEDLLALTGLFIAALGVTLVHFTGFLLFDAAASILIGILLMGFALFLAYETRNLLVGESVTRRRRALILKAVQSFEGVEEILSLRTMHLGSEEVLVALEINFNDSLTVEKLEKLNRKLENKILEIIPKARIYIEASENIIDGKPGCR
ncbi:MAG: cation transporter [Candidatus Aminicenantes bacterium]|nr:cation transporter [Candidatus Aminicenantes bacterium]